METKSNFSKIGKIIILAGHQGSGKSPFVKKLADDSGFKNRCVFDRRREYTGEKYPEHTGKYSFFFEFEEFISAVKQAKGTFIIFEEATAFISNFSDQELNDICTGVEHNQSTIVFVFHRIGAIPKYLIGLCNYVVIFPTVETNESDVENNREILFAAYKKVKSSKKPVIVDVRAVS